MGGWWWFSGECVGGGNGFHLLEESAGEAGLHSQQAGHEGDWKCRQALMQRPK